MSELLAGLGSQALPLPPSQENPMRATTFTKLNDPRSPRSSHATSPLPSSDPVADKSRRQIDAEVQKFEDHIRSLKSQRNFLAPISHLPPEMLAKIFSYRVWEDASTPWPLNWIKVTQVSRHWRSVAFETPSLWSNIVFSHPRWAEEMLKRSKSAGLTIKASIGMSTPRMRGVVELALAQASRIHHLDLNGGHGILEKVLTDLNFEAPMLHSLVLGGPQSNYYSPYDYDHITIPDKVLQCDMPYLRSVELRRCKLNWETQTLANLHSLLLNNITETSRPSTEQLIDMLSRMPDLRVLDLTDALPIVTSAPNLADVDRVVELPLLTRLAITGSTQQCLNLLRRIQIPCSANLQISCASIGGASFEGINEFVGNHQSGPGAKTMRSLHIHHFGYSGMTLQMWTKPKPDYLSLNAMNPPADIQLKYTCSSTNSTPTIEQVGTSVCKLLPMAQVQFLSMSTGWSKLPIEAWKDIFGLLPKLHTIRIKGSSADSFIVAMTAERSEDLTPTNPATRSSDLLSVRRPGLRRRKSAVPAVYFPALRRLEFEEVSFDNYIGGRSLFDVFLDSLMERCERKAEIQELVLRECIRLDEYGVEDIEGVVVDVSWDGEVQGYTDEEEEEEEDFEDYYEHTDYDDFSDEYNPYNFF